jgi:hypothetical protein
MKVVLNTAISGPGGSFGPGEEIECTQHEGEVLIAQGLADPVAAPVAKKAPAKKAAKKRSKAPLETAALNPSDETR